MSRASQRLLPGFALLLTLGLVPTLESCRGLFRARVDPKLSAEAQTFIDEYSARYLALSQEAAEAEWALNTRIVEGDDSNKKRSEAAQKALAAFSGATEVLERTHELLKEAPRLEDLQVRQLESILYSGANLPESAAGLVEERIAAEAEQTVQLFGFPFRIGDREVSANEIDRILTESAKADERLAAWKASKEVGRVLKPGLAKLVDLRNRTVSSQGYGNYFEYQVSEYDTSVPAMMGLLEQLVTELRPLYREIHTWARHELAARYGSEVPDLIPAHWLPNRWGQSWEAGDSLRLGAGDETTEGALPFDIDRAIARAAEASGMDPALWVVKEAEAFYRSLGFGALPATFYERSSLFPLPEGAGYKKNNHASAWHMDLRQDVRCLMSVEPNSRWYETTHHELGHIYYYLAYSRPECPPLLRAGANRAFHEAVGSLLGMASLHKSFLRGRGLIESAGKGLDGDGGEEDKLSGLLEEALHFVVFTPFAAGTMSHFEHDLYATELAPEQYNARWWEYVERFQGIAAPEPRSEEYCDAATKTHINNDAAQYYDYALSEVILHQLHAHIAREILGQDLHDTNYHGNREVGDFLRGILEIGATEEWQRVLERAVGEGLSAEPMLEYFSPLLEHLKKLNAGREHTLPEL